MTNHVDHWRDRAVAAETALADYQAEFDNVMTKALDEVERRSAAEQRVNDLADALREVGDLCFGSWDDGSTGAERNRKAEGIARAALDRQTCPQCGGRGSESRSWDDSPEKCAGCNGTGRAALDRHTHQDKAPTVADCTCVYGTGVTPGCPYCGRYVTLGDPDTHTTREP